VAERSSARVVVGDVGVGAVAGSSSCPGVLAGEAEGTGTGLVGFGSSCGAAGVIGVKAGVTDTGSGLAGGISIGVLGDAPGTLMMDADPTAGFGNGTVGSGTTTGAVAAGRLGTVPSPGSPPGSTGVRVVFDFMTLSGGVGAGMTGTGGGVSDAGGVGVGSTGAGTIGFAAAGAGVTGTGATGDGRLGAGTTAGNSGSCPPACTIWTSGAGITGTGGTVATAWG
jgi:hypothetical protein